MTAAADVRHPSPPRAWRAETATMLRAVAQRPVLRYYLASAWLPVTVATAVAVLLARLAWTQQDGFPVNGDMPYFATAGGHILHGDAGVYRDPDLQAGPVQLVGLRLLQLVAAPMGAHALLAQLVLMSALVATGVMLTGRMVAAGSATPSTARAALALALPLLAVWGVIGAPFVSGHPAEVAVPLLWLIAHEQARRGRAVAAAVALAAATSLETWGVLGAPALLGLLYAETDAATRTRIVVRRVLVSAGVVVTGVAVVYAPFVLSGTFRMSQMTWPMTDQTFAHLIWSGASHFTWSMRAVQTLVTLAVGAGAGWRLRGRAGSGWLLVVTLVSTRLLIDPQLYDYYLLPIRLALVVGLLLAVSAAAVDVSLVVALGGAAVVAFLNGWLPPVAVPVAALTVAGWQLATLRVPRDRRPPAAFG